MTPLSDTNTIIPATAEPSRTNWAGNYIYGAKDLQQPTSVEDVQKLIQSLPAAKAMGARHSFNHIADTEGTQITLSGMKSMELNRAANTVTVGAGVSYGDLAPWLNAQGFAVHNLASLPHISIVGACASATHGSGLRNGCLSTAVSALELVDGSGERITLSRSADPDSFLGAVVGLGALGVLTRITLDVVPAFQVAQTVYENLSFDHLQHRLRDIFSAGYSVSLFTDWQGHRATQAWVKRKLEGAAQPDFPATFFGATRQAVKLHPLPHHDATHCTEQLGEPGPWYERLPHFRTDYTPSSGAELQTEYFVPLDRAHEALLAIEELRDHITPLLHVSEMRSVAADDLWMSMAYDRESLAFHFTWKQQLPAVLALLPLLEAKLEPFAARPHWAKLFTMPGSRLRQLYPRFHDFETFTKRLDPHSRFRNEYLRELFNT